MGDLFRESLYRTHRHLFFSEKGARIVHDIRVIFNIVDIVKQRREGYLLKDRPCFIKQKMHMECAVYGGELSAHHYFRDFAYCDSGMIPWLLIWELVSKVG